MVSAKSECGTLVSRLGIQKGLISEDCSKDGRTCRVDLFDAHPEGTIA